MRNEHDRQKKVEASRESRLWSGRLGMDGCGLERRGDVIHHDFSRLDCYASNVNAAMMEWNRGAGFVWSYCNGYHEKMMYKRPMRQQDVWRLMASKQVFLKLPIAPLHGGACFTASMVGICHRDTQPRSFRATADPGDAIFTLVPIL